MRLHKHLVAVCLAISAIGCQKDVADQIQIPDDRDILLGNLYEMVTKQTLNSPDIEYSLKFDPAFGKPDISRQFKVMGMLNRSGFEVPIKQLKAAIDESISLHQMSRYVYDGENAIHLQLYAYELGHRAALREQMSTDIIELIQDNLEILYAQKAVDTDAYAEMLVMIKSSISEEDFTKHRNYIQSVATEAVESFEDGWQDLQHDLKISNDSSSKIEKYETYLNTRIKAKAYKQGIDALRILEINHNNR